MHFDLVDRVIEQSEGRIVTIKQVSSAEEYLGDHFPGFPVLPGVMMLEAMIAAGRRMLGKPRLVLGSVKALRYGSMVRPGETLRCEVTLSKDHGDGTYTCKGTGKVLRHDTQDDQPETAVTGRFTLRPVTPHTTREQVHEHDTR
ncbi:MAG: polyketide synthase dehydratase domain-containing protein [Phycisphaerales bacterium]|nr:polyketide synthase dehydratase domain-containing protein [Phycisphaerales bacterium]